MSASLRRIWLRPNTGSPVREVQEATAAVKAGLAEDHARAGKREVTVLSLEAWERACADLDAELCPSLRRANLLVSGVDLAETRGQRLRIGSVLLEIGGETKPCKLMEETHPGLWDALKPEWRGGVYAKVLEGGALQPGDAVELISAS